MITPRLRAATSAGYPPHRRPRRCVRAPPRPVLPLRPLAGTDLQALVGLRVCLAILILLSLGSMAFNFVNFGRYGTNVAIQLTLQSILGLLPPVALLVAVSVRNPPAGAALDAVAGFGIASILFRFGYLGFAGAFVHAISQGDYLLTMLPRLVGYSALEAGIAGLALYLRSRVGPINAATLIVATLAFLFWEGLVQAIMTAHDRPAGTECERYAEPPGLATAWAGPEAAGGGIRAECQWTICQVPLRLAHTSR